MLHWALKPGAEEDMTTGSGAEAAAGRAEEDVLGTGNGKGRLGHLAKVYFLTWLEVTRVSAL